MQNITSYSLSCSDTVRSHTQFGSKDERLLCTYGTKQDLRQSALIRAIAFFLNATSDRLNLEEWIDEDTEPEEPAD